MTHRGLTRERLSCHAGLGRLDGVDPDVRFDLILWHKHKVCFPRDALEGHDVITPHKLLARDKVGQRQDQLWRSLLRLLSIEDSKEIRRERKAKTNKAR